MTEQLFLKQFNQLPEGIKKEFLAFFEMLLEKYKNESGYTPKNESNEIDMPPNEGKSLPIVKIERSGTPVPLKFGGGKRLVKYMADDFTALLDDFKEYM